MRKNMSKKIVLIDGHSILNRAFYGIPDLTNAKGQHTNAVYGFLNILFKILEEEKADYLTVAFDVKQPTFRHEMFEAYKGTRKAMPEELREQVPLIKEVLQAMQINIVEKPGYEADDILGTIARLAEREGYTVSLVSGDRDLLQLATEKIKIRIPKTKQGGTEIEDYNATQVIERYGVTPLQIIDLKGLMGDTADNIPGVPSIGEKTATKIITEYGSVENAIAHADEITPKRAKENLQEYAELARLSKALATIKVDCPLDYKIENAGFEQIYNEESYKILKNLEFKSLLAKFDGDMGQNTEVEKNFQIIDDRKKAESILAEMTQCIKKKLVIGFQLVLSEGKGQGNKNENTRGMEQDGQYSLFQAVEEKTKQELPSVFGLAVAYCWDKKEKVIFLKVSEKLSGDLLLEQIKTWVYEEAFLSVFDLKALLKATESIEGFAWNAFGKLFDCSIGAYLLNPLQDMYHYDDIARDYLGLTLPAFSDLFGKLSIEQAKQEQEKEFIKYCCYQAYVAFLAHEPLCLELKKTNMLSLFWEIEMPLVYTLHDMELRGIRVNKEELKAYGDKLALRIVELEQEIYKLSGEEFNINSPLQLGIILFEKMQLPGGKKTKRGYSTSADILEKLKEDFPIVDKILEYRQLTKLKSTYADGLANYICEEDERIHGTFNQTITATGRLSSTEPNLQNIPIRMALGREIRKVFIPEQDYVFLDADYSQIELRILAHMSDDKQLIEAYNSNEDIHRITASEVFHTPLEEVSELQRSNAKAVNFGIVYGISSFGLGQGLNITRKEAEMYIHKYFETYPKVKSFLEELVSFGKEHGYVESLLKRRRPIPELKSGNFMQRSFGERVAMNSPIQGTAADIIKIAMIRVNEKLKALHLKSKLILQIHDELLVETHKEEIEQVKQILEEEMFGAVKLSVALEIEVKQGMNWNEAH